MTIIEAIKQRHSVRSYLPGSLTGSQQSELTEYASAAASPFGGHVTIRLRHYDLSGGFRPSTYGMIKGATDFFIIGIADDDMSALSAGFRFEQVVLRACQLGLGTCWIGGTFKGSDFDRDESWPDGERLRIVCPVGKAGKQRLIERVAHAAIGSSRRKPFDRLFYDGDFDRPLSPDSRYGQSLEMLRLAPSSTNSQPWRAVVCDNTVHFYYRSASSYALIDCGIALCHFYETEKYLGRQGAFFNSADAPLPSAGLLYLTSYKPE